MVNTAAESRRARAFKAEFGPMLADNGAKGLQLLQSLNAHARDHDLFERDMRDSLGKSLAVLTEMAPWQEQLVEWNRLLATRTPDEWAQWARRVSGAGDAV